MRSVAAQKHAPLLGGPAQFDGEATWTAMLVEQMPLITTAHALLGALLSTLLMSWTHGTSPSGR